MQFTRYQLTIITATLVILIFENRCVYREVTNSRDKLLVRYNMISLSAKRDFHIVKLLRNLINGKIDCPSLLLVVALYIPKDNSGHNHQFYIPTTRSNALRRAPVLVMCRCADVLIDDSTVFMLISSYFLFTFLLNLRYNLFRLI